MPTKDDMPCRELRKCKDCRGNRGNSPGPREKYIFLVRHAQSTWNGKVDLVKTVRYSPLDGISMKDVVSSAAQLMTKEVWHRDHPISKEGMNQIEAMRKQIAEYQQEPGRGDSSMGCSASSDSSGGSSSSTSSSARTEAERRRVLRFYNNFLSLRERKSKIYCSPLLRALQTAHLLFPPSEAWGSIKLLKDAREHFNYSMQRDCLGDKGAVGEQIVGRAMKIAQEIEDMEAAMQGLENRVDSVDCAEQWWEESPESESQVGKRLCSLWRRLLEEDKEGSCVLVTHSNLIKALMMRFGIVDDSFILSGHRSTDTGSDGREGASSSASRQSTGDRSAVKACTGDAPESASEADYADSDFEQPCSDETELAGPSSWQVVRDGPSSLRRLKVERLQNCGVLGLRCESAPQPAQADEPKDGDYTLLSPLQWVAKDALLMFGSILVN